MRLLLDTHILVWWPAGSRRLGTRAAELIMDADSRLFMSAASWWELGIKRALGRIEIDISRAVKAVEERGVASIPVTMGDAEQAATLERLHSDPFDHMLVAQAIEGDMKLLTRNKRLTGYGTAVLVV